jgi:nucleotide-binding universal stress UspA family protein
MYQHILLAYDGTLEGRLALREGALLAKISGAKVTLMAVVDPGYGAGFGVDPIGGYFPPDQTASFQTVLDEGGERLTRMGLSHQARLERGQPAERIAAVARDISADLVVVGHHRQGVVAGWLLGSVASDLTNSLQCSLLVARKEISDDALFARRPELPQ